jgi:mannose-6-phosphate isomerase-like protein (cupin superfamily)
MTEPAVRNLDAVLASIPQPWSPRTVAVVNDYDVRVARAEGEFSAHRHLETDEFFLVLSGRLTIVLDDGEVTLEKGDTYVVARGVRHQPRAASGTTLLLFEPSATVNTGDSPSELTATRRLA